MNYRIDLGFV